MTKHPVTIVKKITASQEKAHRKKSYRPNHHLGNLAEIDLVGREQFDYVNKRLQDIPKGHFAATHTPRHHILISQEALDLFPKSMQSSIIKEFKIHEITEDKGMEKARRKNK